MRILLDTHIWVWWLTPDSPLSGAERAGLDVLAGQRSLSVSAISLWETRMLHAKRRLETPLPFAGWLRRATDARMLSVVPLDADVVIALDALPQSFHGDPADRLIVATARAHGLALATHDAAIRRSRLVALWKP